MACILSRPKSYVSHPMQATGIRTVGDFSAIPVELIDSERERATVRIYCSYCRLN